MTTRINEYTILNGLINALNYFLLDNQEYDWEFSQPAAVKKQKIKKSPRAEKRREKKMSNVDEAIKKKKRDNLLKVSFAALILMLTAGAGFWYYYQEKQIAAEKALMDSLYITFADTDVIEYGLDPVDAKSLIIDSEGNINADPEVIYPSVLNPVTISYSVSGKTDYPSELETMQC